MDKIFHLSLLLICLFAESFRLYEKLSTLYSKEVGLSTSLILIILIVYMSFFDAKYKGIRVSVIITILSIVLGLFISIDPLYQTIQNGLHPIPKQHLTYPEKPKEPIYQAGNRSEYSENVYLWQLHTEKKNYKKKLEKWELEKVDVDKKNKEIDQENKTQPFKVDFYEFSFKLIVSLILGIIVPFGVFYSSEKLKTSLLTSRKQRVIDLNFASLLQDTATNLQETAIKKEKFQDFASEIEIESKKKISIDNQNLVVKLRKSGMTVKQISEYLSVSDRTVYYWLSKEKSKSKV